jgi:hypothetical protein
MLIWNCARHKSVLVLLFSRVIFQSRLWQHRAVFASSPPGRIYFGFLQELLEGIAVEVGPNRYAQPNTVGKQTPVAPDHQG